MSFIKNYYGILGNGASFFIPELIIEDVVVGHEDEMGNFFGCFFIEEWTESLTFALVSDLLQILDGAK